MPKKIEIKVKLLAKVEKEPGSSSKSQEEPFKIIKGNCTRLNPLLSMLEKIQRIKRVLNFFLDESSLPLTFEWYPLDRIIKNLQSNKKISTKLQSGCADKHFANKCIKFLKRTERSEPALRNALHEAMLPLMFTSCSARSNRSTDLAGTELAKRS